MAEETVRLYSSGAASVEAESWAALGSKKFWEELAQAALKEAEAVANPTTRGIKTTGTINQSMVYGTEAEAKIPVGAIIKAVVVHWFGKASATANKLTYQKTSEGGTEIATKTLEAGSTVEKWFKATLSAGDLEKISRNSFASNAFRAGWTNSKSGSEVRWNVSYVEVTFETAASVTVPLQAAASSSSASLAVTSETAVSVEPATAASAATLAVTANTSVPLAAAAGQSTAACAVTAETTLPLQPAVSASAAYATVSMLVPVPLAAANSQSAGTCRVTAQIALPLQTAVSTSTATATVSTVIPVPLQAATSSSGANIALSAVTNIPLGLAAAVSNATLALTSQTRVPLQPASSISAASCTVTIQLSGDIPPLVSGAGSIQVGSAAGRARLVTVTGAHSRPLTYANGREIL